MKKRVLIYFILAQIIITVSICYSILAKKAGHVLGIASSELIPDPHLVRTPTDKLKYFFEPKANITYTDGTEQNALISINHDSLNETKDYDVEKPSNTYRIITIGDSFTFGEHISTRSNWTEVLENSLNHLSCKGNKKFEVINLGVSAYDAACSVERFKKRGIKYNPDLVIWYQVDLLRSNEEIRKEMDKIVGASFGYQKIVDGKDIWNTARDVVLKKFGKDKLLQQNEESISELRNYFKGKVVIATHPLMDGQFIDILKELSKKNDYVYAENFRNYFNLNGYFMSDRHPNIKGHEIIAEDILKLLTQKDILPCN